MSLSDTFLKLEIDTTFAPFAALSAGALNSLTVCIGGGNIAVMPYISPGGNRGFEGLHGMSGHNGRLHSTQHGIMIGRNGLELPLDSLRTMNPVHIERLADEVSRGKLKAKILNKGETIGTDSFAWRDGPDLSAFDIRQRGMLPQKLWNALQTNQDPSVEADSLEKFLYIPRAGGSIVTAIIHPIAVSGGGPLTLEWHGWSAAANSRYRIATESITLDGTEPWTVKVETTDPYLMPLITSGMDGVSDDVDVYVGFSLTGI